ncbi:HCR017Cp [Eremothecium sinecaudum]|uniref:HCR017Cp n=1 Tax=Eremothecium sinecaudum TaxID=45286 RepID=A0A0X8HRK2_9SACH|nr:HCR017Cp [Eremothecium sinecaudum]AMD20167.1 HCR017Cp [Eremothecium sinecaudum]
MSVWRKAGLTYNSYLAVAAKTIRSALKTELQSAAILGRSVTEAKIIEYKTPGAASEPVPLKN